MPLDDDMRFRAREAMHTIARAEEHKRDPELMKHVRALAAEVHRAVGAGGKKALVSNPLAAPKKKRGV